MLMIFKNPRNVLEGYSKLAKAQAKDFSDESKTICTKCKKALSASELVEQNHVCLHCRHHFMISARMRLSYICDKNSFIEIDSDMTSKNILSFPEYDKKLNSAKHDSRESEAVICGKCTINANPVYIFVMNPQFMMGSMGTVVGEKITRTFERATEEGLPVIGFTVSGGARMQEGILSLMQMAKVSGAVKRHSDAGLLYICVLTDPTTGGVTASFAMQADIIIAEPGARVAFAGPRVIEQTTGKKLPEGFQSSEFLLEKGFVDSIIDRNRQKRYIRQILRLHRRTLGENS